MLMSLIGIVRPLVVVKGNAALLVFSPSSFKFFFKDKLAALVYLEESR